MSTFALRLLLPVAALALLAVPADPARAQSGQTRGAAAPAAAPAAVRPPLIAVIDVQAVIREANAARNIREQIEAKRAAYQDELAKRERELRAAEQELSRQRQSLPADQFNKRRQDFEQKVADVQRDVQAKKRQLDTGFSQAMEQVRDTLIQIVADLANETKANIVLSKQAVVIVEKSLDISRPALDRLNQRLPRVTVNLPPLK
ncbi:MAG: hypothetical protein OHK0024_10670 [Thalassobaculales bacterium]